MNLRTLLISCAALALASSYGHEDDRPTDSASLKKEIQAMRVKDIAWRKIAWKTCLLDGIKASRQTGFSTEPPPAPDRRHGYHRARL